MRASELLEHDVQDESGRSLGAVHDIHVVQDGPVVEGFGALLRVCGLVIGRGTFGTRLGFSRSSIKGPWPLVVLARRLDRRAVYVPWERVVAVRDGVVTISGTADDLGRPPVTL